MPTYTNMRVCDIKMFGKSINSFYPALYGTPAADIAIRLNKKLQDLYKFETTVAPDYTDNYDEMDGTFHVILEAREKIPEERLQESGIDKDVNDALEQLRTAVAENAYPEGSLTRSMVDYMIRGLEKLRRRDLLVNVDENPEAAPLTGTDVAFKTAEYTIVPKIYVQQVQPGAGENGQDLVTNIFPESFVADDPSYEILHREDQTDRAHYSLGELQESANRLNFGNVHDAAISLSESESYMYNMLSVPAEPTAQELAHLKTTVITNLDSLRGEMDRALEVPQNDPVGLRLYGDTPARMNAVLTADPNGRGYRNNIQDMDNYRRYLNSGLPVLGYFEYKQMLHDLENAKNTCGDYGDILTNGNSFVTQTNNLYNRLIDLPDGPEGIDAWRGEVTQLMQNWLAGCRNLQANPSFRQDSQKAANEAREAESAYREAEEICNSQLTALQSNGNPNPDEVANLQTVRERMHTRAEAMNSRYTAWDRAKSRVTTALNPGGTLTEIAGRISGQYMNDMNHLGRRTKQERNKYVTDMLDSMMKNMDDMADDLTGFMNDANRVMSPGLQAAIDKTVRYADRNALCGPEQFVEQLTKIRTEIGRENAVGHHQNDDIKEWADRQITYFNNRTLEAKSKGILTSDSLLYQKNLRERQNGDHLNEALEQFNSRRSSWYRLNFSNHYTREFGVETNEHIMLRVAATRLGEMKGELAAINKEQNPVAWRNKMIDMQQQALTVADRAKNYMKEKNFQRPSGNGGTRYDGAARLYAEAEMMFLDYKTQVAMFDRYRELDQLNQQYQQEAAARENRRVPLNPQVQAQQANPQGQPAPQEQAHANADAPVNQNNNQAEVEVGNNIGHVGEVIAINQEVPVEQKNGSVHIVNFNEMMKDPKVSQVKQKDVIRRKPSVDEDAKDMEDKKEIVPKAPGMGGRGN